MLLIFVESCITINPGEFFVGFASRECQRNPNIDSVCWIWIRHSGGPPLRGIIVIITLTLTLS